MASKINPKGVFKSNAKPKGPNPRGINKVSPAAKINPKGINPVKSGINSGGINKGGINKPSLGPGKSNLPVYKGSTTPTKVSVKSNVPVVKGTNTPTKIGTGKIKFDSTPSKVQQKSSSLLAKGSNVANKFGKIGKVASKLKGVAGKAGAAATLFQIGSIIHDDVNERAKAIFKREKDKKDKAAAKAKADKIKKTTPVKTLLETPSLKDELKKRGVDFKPTKDKAKTNWLDTAKKGDTLKYVINKPKAETKKDNSKKGALPKAIDYVVRAIDGNQPGSGASLKFTGDKSKVGGKDKWGRSPSDKWYGFNPNTKKYEAPKLVKDNAKKSETKVETKKPTTPKVTTPKTTTPKATTPAVKKAEPVGTLVPKSTQEITSKSLEEAKTIVPSKTTTPTSTSTSSSSTSSSPAAIGVQPSASIGNKIRGMINASRERKAGRAASRGNEERSEKLKEKISATEKKMMMKKGGVVKSKTKKK